MDYIQILYLYILNLEFNVNYQIENKPVVYARRIYIFLSE